MTDRARPLRIAKLTKYGRRAASTRQRFDQYEPFLAERGCETVDWPLLSDDYLDRLFSGRPMDRREVASAYVRRARQILTAKDIDLFWVHSEVFPYLPGLAERLIGWKGKPIVVDLDDAIFHNYDSRGSRVRRALFGRKIVPLLNAASAAICGNAYLRDYAQRFARETHVVPTVLDTEIYRPMPSLSRGDRPLTIGWLGSPSTWNEYVEPMRDLLLEEAERAGAEILAVGAAHDAAPHPRLRLEPWLEDQEVEQIARMDVCIMPLDDSPWARGKCGYKLIQYMACGRPVIASPIGVNSKIVQPDVNGFLAANPEEWRISIRTLLADADLRCRMGEAGRDRAVADYSLRAWGPRLAAILAQKAGENGARGRLPR